jgi:hypothetical protein
VRIANDAEGGLAGAGRARGAGKVQPGEAPGGCATAWVVKCIAVGKVTPRAAAEWVDANRDRTEAWIK